MCGIAGFTHGARGLDEAVIRRMTASLTHRGPDQQVRFFNSDIALGAARLGAIDLEGSQQPLRIHDHVIVFDGEIYNHKELRAELEARGHRFVSNCQVEVALRAFCEWDTACFRRFRGMFALGIWNIRRKRLVLTRDRVGMKPLYLAKVGREVVFGSELKAVFAHPRISRTLDLNALQDYLSLNYVPGPRTLVEGIEKLEPGCCLEWRDGACTVTRWWNPCLTPDITMDEREAEGELDRLLRESVREHLRSDVPLGVWTNGGLDSSTLVHYAAELSSAKLKTFSIGSEPHSKQIARHYGAEHFEFEWNAKAELLPALEDLAYHSDEPAAGAGALPVWFLSKLSRQQVTVALSGEGGDQLFGGQPRRFLPQKLHRWLKGSSVHPDEAHLSRSGSFSIEQKQRLLPNRNPQRLFHLYAGLPDAEAAGEMNRYLLVDQHNYLPDALLNQVDRLSMAHALEVRTPLLDHRIVELARKMPERMKVRKAMLKRVMKGKLPAQLLSQGKRQPATPADDWLRGPLLPFLNETLHPGAVRRTGLFDAPFVTKLMRDHRDRRVNAGSQLWALMTLFLWFERWDIMVPPVMEFMEAGTLAAAS